MIYKERRDQIVKQLQRYLQHPNSSQSTLFTSLTMDDYTAVVLDNGSGMCKAGCEYVSGELDLSLTRTIIVAGDDAPRAVFP
jgi:hypothetical protein